MTIQVDNKRTRIIQMEIHIMPCSQNQLFSCLIKHLFKCIPWGKTPLPPHHRSLWKRHSSYLPLLERGFDRKLEQILRIIHSTCWLHTNPQALPYTSPWASILETTGFISSSPLVTNHSVRGHLLSSNGTTQLMSPDGLPFDCEAQVTQKSHLCL